MTKQVLTAALLSIGAALFLTIPAHADIVQTLPLSTGISCLSPTDCYYDSPDGYDFDTTFPGPGSTTIGTFTFSIPTGDEVGGITISGTFGNGDSGTTALSDYYLGFGGEETAVEVAACDNPSANCYSGQEGPYSWTATLTAAELADLAPALAAGSLDFTYTWGSSPPVMDALSPTGYDDQYVYAGDPTIDIQVVPEPASVLLCFSALAGIAALRRFRKV
jgi:hypothetical protein